MTNTLVIEFARPGLLETALSQLADMWTIPARPGHWLRKHSAAVLIEALAAGHTVAVIKGGKKAGPRANNGPRRKGTN